MDTDLIIAASYDHRLVTLSILISMLAAYAAGYLIGRVRDARGRAWLVWLLICAIVDGIGIWSMHHTGTLALRLPDPVLLHWPTILLSLLVSITGSAGALLVLGRNKISWPRAVAASILLGGVGISGLHYTALSALGEPVSNHYSPWVTALSVGLAVVISLLSLSLSFLPGDNQPDRRLRYHMSIMLRGLATPVMHYVAMHGVTFTYSNADPNLSHAVSISSLGILGIIIVPIMVIVVALLTSLVDRLQKQRALLDELFEQAPQAVALMSSDYKIIRINREFTQLFGYDGKEAIGRDLREMIIPAESKEEIQKYSDMLARGQRVEAEGIRLRKDGSRLYASVIHVPVSLPGGQIARYAIYRDITERERRIRELRESEEKFKTVLENSRDLIYHLNLNDGTFNYLSPAAEKITGHSVEELMRGGLAKTRSLIHPDDLRDIDAQAEQALADMLKDQMVSTIEYRITTKDGDVRWISDSRALVIREEGVPIAVVGTARDITEGKLAAQVLHESQEKYRSIVETANEGIWLIDVEGRTTYVNHQLAEITGYSVEEMLGRPIFDFIFDEDKPLAEYELIQRRNGLFGRGEFRLRRKDGSVVETLYSASPVKSQEGDITGFLAMIIDITERKLREEALRKSEAQYRRLIETSYEGVLMFDRKMRITFANQRLAEMLNVGAEDLIGTSAKEFVADTSRDDIERRWQQRAEGVKEQYDLQLCRSDGSRLWAIVSATPIFDDQGEFTGTLSLLTDITERKRAERNLSAQYRVARTLSESATLDEATPRILQAVCESLGWELGALWRVDRDVDALRCVEIWHVPGVEVTEFEALSRDRLFDRQMGLPGSVWQSNAPVWITDITADKEFPRAAAAARNGMHAGFGFPIRIEGEIIGVMEFYSRQVQPPDESLLNMLETFSSQIGQFIERKVAEEAQRESEERFRTLAETASDAIISIDEASKITYINHAAENIFGYTVAEMKGSDLTMLMPDYLRHLHNAGLQRYVETGHKHIHWHGVELPGLHKDGHEIPVEISFSDYAKNGKRFFTGIIRDITERKRAEEQLRQRERELAEAQRQAHVGSWNWDIRNDILTWSEELYRIFGVDRQRFIPGYEKPFLEFIPAEDRASLKGLVEDSLNQKGPFSYYYRILRPDGEKRVIHSQGDIVIDEQGNPIRMFGTAQDVTERKKAEERLRATTEQLRALSARIHSVKEEEGTRIAREIHDELGAALTSLKWDLESFDKIVSTLGDQSQIPVLRERIDAMLRLADVTILSIRRISSELRPSVLDDLGLAEAIEWQAEQFQARTGIICQCDCSLGRLDLGREQSTAVFRIFQEALTNIMRHARATGVVIRMKEEAGEFILRIVDNGRGITESERTGAQSLGLLGMQERAHLIGGNINITGMGGEGTEITVRVPFPD